jgi:predicted CXXCH cytochrome family protein
VPTRIQLRLLLLAFSCALVPVTARAATAEPPGGYVGADTCLTCHDGEGKSLSHTEHARAANPRTPMAGVGCESCHGPGKAHVDGDGDVSKIRVFPKMAPRDVTAVCMSCHNRGEHTFFQGSMHDSRNLSCITCHSVHSPKSEQAQLKTPTEIALCVQCHRPWDRMLRLLVGLALLYAGWNAWPGTIGLVFLVLGAVAIGTGIVGWCPAYSLFRASTKKVVG